MWDHAERRGSELLGGTNRMVRVSVIISVAIAGLGAFLLVCLEPVAIVIQGGFLQRIASVFVVSAIIERVVSLFVTMCRSRETRRLSDDLDQAKLSGSKGLPDAIRAFSQHRSETHQLFLMMSVIVGLLFSILGFRVLELLSNGVLHSVVAGQQQLLIRCVDLILSGILLAAMAEVVHRFVSLVTLTLASASSRVQQGSR